MQVMSVCRCKPVQDRPSKWSRPSSSFICWCACSQIHRALIVAVKVHKICEPKRWRFQISHKTCAVVSTPVSATTFAPGPRIDAIATAKSSQRNTAPATESSLSRLLGALAGHRNLISDRPISAHPCYAWQSRRLNAASRNQSCAPIWMEA